MNMTSDDWRALDDAMEMSRGDVVNWMERKMAPALQDARNAALEEAAIDLETRSAELEACGASQSAAAYDAAADRVRDLKVNT